MGGDFGGFKSESTGIKCLMRVNGCIENGKVIEDLDTIEADVDQWKCGLCSFLNSDNIEICRLCNNVKSKFSDNRNNQGGEEEGEYIEGGEAVERILEGVADLAERQEEGEGRVAVYGIEGEEGGEELRDERRRAFLGFGVL